MKENIFGEDIQNAAEALKAEEERVRKAAQKEAEERGEKALGIEGTSITP